jgi:hypothetical protein
MSKKKVMCAAEKIEWMEHANFKNSLLLKHMSDFYIIW